MPRQNVIQPSFTNGEVSPFLVGRVDTRPYANGLRTCENFIVRPQGGLSYRGGTQFCEVSGRSSTTGKLVPFIFSDTDSFQIEFGDYYARVLQGGFPVLNSTLNSSISAVANVGGNIRITFSNENRISVTPSDNGSGLYRLTSTIAHGLVSGDRVYYNDEFTIFEVTYISSTVVDLVGSTYAVTSGPFFMYTTNLISGSSSSGGLIKITTDAPHGLDTGDKIFMSHRSTGVDFTNSPATFDWTITVVDDTSFTLDGSSYHAGHDGDNDVYVKWLRNGQRITISGTGGSQDLNGAWRVIQSTSRGLVVLANSTFVGLTTGTYTVDFNQIRLETPWAEDELDELQYCQSADVLYLMHPDHPTRKLVRFSADVWTLQEISFIDGPYLPLQDNAPNVDSAIPANGTQYPDVYMELSNYSHTATVTSASNFAGGAGDQNKYLEYRDGDQWRLAQLTSASSGVATGTVAIIENVLLHLDETTKLKNTPSKKRQGWNSGNQRVTYDAGAANASQSVPGAGSQQRVDPNNFVLSGATTGTGTLTSNYSNTFGVADIGKYVRFFDATAIANNAGPIPRWAQIYKLSNSTGTTALHSAAVTMVSNRATGNFVISDHSRTATVSAYKAGVGFALFTATDVGRHIRLGWAGRWTWGIIATVAGDLKSCTVTLNEDVPRDPHNAANLAGYSTTGVPTYIAGGGTGITGTTSGRTYDWRLGAWSETTGYPSTASFHEQRLIFGRTDTQPSTFWGSITGDFENMRPTELDSTVLDDNAINYTLASGRINSIKWLESGTNLVIGTDGGEWLARSSSAVQEPITPRNISVTQQSHNGSSAIAKPMRIGSSIVFVDRSEMNVMEVQYLYSEDRLADKDLTVVSEHIIRQGGTVVQTAFQQNPNMIGWFCLSDGTLAALTYNQEQEVIAWHRHFLSGTGAEVESICVTPSSDATTDIVYMLVKRTINGSTKRTIEFLTDDFYPSGSSRLGMTFVDDCVVLTGWTSLTVGGLYHLEAETVTAIVDGTLRGTFTVSSGSITMTGNAPVSEIVIGKAYTATAKSLPIEGGSGNGTSQGMKKRIAEMKVRVYNSFDFNFGWESDLVAKDLTAYTIVRTETTLPYFTGTVPVVPKNPYDEESPWTITQDQPYPLNVLAVVSVVETTQ